MGKVVVIVCTVLCVLFGIVSHSVWKKLYTVPVRPKTADENPWWGPGEPTKEKVLIKEFIVNVSDSVSNIF